MTTTTHTIDAFCLFGLDVEITYTYTPGAPATRIDPADPTETGFASAKASVPLDPSLQKLLDDWAADWVGDEGFSACCQQADYDNDGE
jgi:hypothetical protein